MWSFLNGILGASGVTILNGLFALGVVLLLIVLALWALKFVFRTTTNVARGRNRRLLIVDNLPVDQKRQLLIIRRDNVEHLVMIGGGRDLVIESGIPVEAQPVRRPTQPARPAQGPRQPAPPGAVRLEPGERVVPVEPAREPGKAAGPSLRHTGLMREAARVEPAVIHDNSDPDRRAASDSGRTEPVNGRSTQREAGRNGQAPSDDDFYGPYRGSQRFRQER
jgi:hypothetical protein